MQKCSARGKIIELLANSSPKTPKELAEQTGVVLNNVSNYLATLQELGLVCCLNDELRKGRLYALTDKGIEIHRAMIVIFQKHSQGERTSLLVVEKLSHDNILHYSQRLKLMLCYAC